VHLDKIKESRKPLSHAKPQRTQRKASQSGVSRSLADARRFNFWVWTNRKLKHALKAVLGELGGFA
jgi:hypothetical protein